MQNPDEPSTRPVLSRADALALAGRVLALVGDRNLGVQITHSARAVTKVSRGRILRTEAGNEVRITLSTEIRPRCDIHVRTNQLDDASLKRVLERANAIAPVAPAGEGLPAMDYSVLNPTTYGPRDFLPVSLWHPSTASAMEGARGQAVSQLVDKVQSAGYVAAATISLSARATCYVYRYGLAAFADETDAELSVTARTKDGTMSAWGGQAHRDWNQISPTAVAQHAKELADLGKNPVAFEPGRRTVILSATAVGQLVRLMARMFSLDETYHGFTPFSTGLVERKARKTKRGQRVFDPRLMMISDPADPMGGFPPFTEEGGYEYARLGFPVQPATWIDRGVLTTMAAGAGGEPPCDLPRSVRLAPVSGNETATIDQMIANCQSGIYINRFSNVNVIDMLTGMMTGATRDGCFLVKQGKIIKAVKNFRFVESPILAFNRIEMIGVAERVALAQEPPTSREDRRWPSFPIIASPMMIRDFNLTGLSDSV